MEEQDKKEVAKEILKSFHNQFSENQNHQQKIFLQFFSAILVAAIPFGVVFVKTTDQAQFWNPTMDAQGNIISYAISHLIGSWLLIQIALITLSAFTLKIAYSFRRDQKVVEKIRKSSLGSSYEDLFGNKSFSAGDKKSMGGKSYVPLFCAIFWQFSIFLQITSSLILFFRTQNISSMKHIVLLLVVIGVTALTSVTISYFWRYYYYLKYKLTVEGMDSDDLKQKSVINPIFYFFLDISKKD
jgi:hypothetical protein